jgi:hypothetical protein
MLVIGHTYGSLRQTEGIDFDSLSLGYSQIQRYFSFSFSETWRIGISLPLQLLHITILS